jgi:hypothetical protein
MREAGWVATFTQPLPRGRGEKTRERRVRRGPHLSAIVYAVEAGFLAHDLKLVIDLLL